MSSSTDAPLPGPPTPADFASFFERRAAHVRALVSKPGAEAAHGFPVSLLDIAAASPGAAAALLSWPSEGLDALNDALLEAQEAAVAPASAEAEAGMEGGAEDGRGGLADENVLSSSVSVKARAAVRLLPPPAPLLPLLSAGNALGGSGNGTTSGSFAAKPGSSSSASLPTSLSRSSFPLSRLRAQHAGALVSLTGTVVRAGGVVALEAERSFECAACGARVRCRADLATRSAPAPPAACEGCRRGGGGGGEGGGGGRGNRGGGGGFGFGGGGGFGRSKKPSPTSWIPLDDAEPPSHADFQEALLAEGAVVSGGGCGGCGGGGGGGAAAAAAAAAARSPLPLLLLDDLAGRASAGDSVTVVGVLVRRWRGVAPSVASAAASAAPGFFGGSRSSSSSASSAASSAPAAFSFSVAQPREGSRCDVDLALVVHGAVGGRFGDGGEAALVAAVNAAAAADAPAGLLPPPPPAAGVPRSLSLCPATDGGRRPPLLFQDKFLEYWAFAAAQGATLRARDAVVAGIAPHLAGLFAPKLAVALQLAAPPPARGRAASSSSTKANATGSSSSSSSSSADNASRRSVHVLLRGEAGTGKSALLAAAVACRGRRGVLVFGGRGGGGGGGGGGTSAAGLTAAAAKDPATGEWGLEPGALVLADGGLCALDGLDALPLDQRGALHEAMEQQSVSVAKAGLVATLPTRACVLASAAAPPKNGKGSNGGGGGGRSSSGWKSSSATLEAPLLSRFDLVFVLRDPRTREFDESVCDAVLGQEEEDDEEEEEMEEEEEVRRRRFPASQSRPSSSSSSWPRPWPPELVQEYAQWLRTRPAPTLSKGAERVLLAAYRARRRRAAAAARGLAGGGDFFGAGGSDFFGGNNSGSGAPAPAAVGGDATIRHLESLARVAVAHARLVGREEAGEQDAVVAVALADAAAGGGGGSGSGGSGRSEFDPPFSSSSSQQDPSAASQSFSTQDFSSSSSSSFFDGGGIGRGVVGVPACDAVRSRPCADPDAASAAAARAVGAMVEREEALARRAAALAAGAAGRHAEYHQYGDDDEEEEEEEEEEGHGHRGGGGGSYF